MVVFRYWFNTRNWFRRYQLTLINWIFLVGFSVLLTVTVYFFLKKSEHDILVRAALTTRTSLKLTRETVKDIWWHDQEELAGIWASDPDLVDHTKHLVSLSLDKDALLKERFHTGFQNLIRKKAEKNNVLDVTIISPDLINVASSIDERIGHTSVISKIYRERLYKVFDGQNLMIPPFKSDVPLRDALGNLVNDLPCTFVCTPIRDHTGKIIAALAIRYDPRRDLSLLMRTGFFGESGDAYLVDKFGNMVSESRFVSDLIEADTVDDGPHSPLTIEVRDPGKEIQPDSFALLSSRNLPFTFSVQQVMQGKSDYRETSYRDYKGDRVLGAWLWDEDMGVGFITEISRAEALLPYYDTFNIAVGLSCVTTLFAFVMLIGWRKITIDSNLKSEQRLRLATESAGIYVWEWDIRNDKAVVTNDSLNLFFGFDPQKGKAGETLKQRTHPDDLIHTMKALNDHLQGKTDSCYTEFRYRHPKDEEYLWISFYGKVVEVNKDGSAKTVFGVSENIHKRKSMEEHQKQEWQGLQSILDSSPVGVVVCVDGIVKSCNSTHTEMLGLRVGDRATERIYKRREDRIHMLQQLESTGAINGMEIQILNPKGETIDVMVTAYKTEYLGERALVYWVVDITAQKKAAQELALLNELVYNGMEASNVGAWWMDFVEEGTYYALDNTAQLLGVPVSTRNQSYSLQPWMATLQRSAIVHPKFKPLIDEVLERFEGTITGKYPDFKATYPVITENGKIRWINARGAVPKRDQHGIAKFMAGVLIDVTEQREVEEAIIRSEEEFRFSLEAIEAYYWVLDLRTRALAYDSDQFYKQYGYTEDEIPRSVEDHQKLNHPDDLVASEAIWKDHLSGATRAYKSEQRIKRKDGQWAWTLNKARAIEWDEDGNSTKIAGISFDITQQKETESELYLAKEEAIKATQSKSEFLARMSHEIRTPMNAIIGITYLTLQTELSQKQRDNLKKVHDSGLSLLEIINDILDFSKIEAGKLELEYTDFDLEKVFNDLANVVTYKAHEKGLEVVFDLQQTLPSMLVGDPLRLKQVLINLANNAVKFTSQGEIVVRAQMSQMTDDRIAILFSIRDTGIGMISEEIDHLFQSFSQADSSTTRKYGGTGLGLSISKNLVEMLGGEIWVESEKGKGSTFFFTAWFDMNKYQKPRELKPPLDLRGMRVLVCDDNETASEVIKEVLEGFTFRVKTVNSGSLAIEELENNSDDPYQLLFMDWNMPVMDGVKTVEQIKSSLNIKPAPITIMLTAYNRQDVLQAAESIGIDSFLVKPVGYSTLFDTIMMLFHKESYRLPVHEPGGISPELSASLKGALVLLVEDNKVNQEVAMGMLEECGVRAEVANNGQEGFDMVKASGVPSKYKAVIMDLRMPVMDGYEATRAIRMLHDYDDLPIIAMTADVISGIKEKCIELGMNDFINKPIEPDQFYGALARWIVPKSVVPMTPISMIQSIQEEMSFPDIPGVDKQARLKRFKTTASYLKFLVNFGKHFAGFIDDLKVNFEQGELEKSARMVHDLKGLSGMLDAQRLHDFAVGLDDKLRKNAPIDTGAELSVLHELLDPVLVAIRSIVADYNPGNVINTKPKGELDEAVAIKALQELNVLLKQGDFESVKKATAIMGIDGINRYSDAMNEIAGLIAEYEFDKALNAVKKLIQQINH